jgi:hypothetical protein
MFLLTQEQAIEQRIFQEIITTTSLSFMVLMQKQEGYRQRQIASLSRKAIN